MREIKHKLTLAEGTALIGAIVRETHPTESLHLQPMLVTHALLDHDLDTCLSTVRLDGHSKNKTERCWPGMSKYALQVITEPPTAPEPEPLLVRKLRLERELRETEESIEREGVPEHWIQSTGSNGTVFEDADSQSVQWSSTIQGDRSGVCIVDGDGEVASVDAVGLFAWVDRVRELGETNL